MNIGPDLTKHPYSSPPKKDKLDKVHPIQPPNSETIESDKITQDKTDKMLSNVIKNKNNTKEFDYKFNCPDAIFSKYCFIINKHLDQCLGSNLSEDQKFNSSAFLRGVQGNSSEQLAINQKFLAQSTNFVEQIAKEIAQDQKISLEDSYKMLIGLLDTYDDAGAAIHKSEKTFYHHSTFILRTAILLSSQNNGIGLQSWVAYTKSGKPAHNNDLWNFLNNWKNWIPEAQGAMAKFSETTFIKAKELAAQHPENQIVLLKGGFGAGKTRLANELIGDSSPGIIAPDTGKRVVRRSMDTYPHASAHIQGSQIAYKLFEDMIVNMTGTVVYDSALSLASDVKNYLSKSKELGKKMIVYDVARHDMARILSVLKRSVKGDDPRIPPSLIIEAAIKDKINRAECMKVILDDKIEKGKELLAPEYHFIGGDAQGWNAEKVVILSPGKIEKLHPEMQQRLEYEGIKITQNNDKILINQTFTKEQLSEYYADQLERQVKDILKDISAIESQALEAVFKERVFHLDILSGRPITDASSFYEALPVSVKNSIPQEAFVGAFNELKPKTSMLFFQTLTLPSISYLDLPLKAALIIHQNLQTDPWIKPIAGESLLF